MTAGIPRLPQEKLDDMTYDMYLDCHRSAADTARQMGISPSTVRNRVRRHVRRLHPPAYISQLSPRAEAILARIELERDL